MKFIFFVMTVLFSTAVSAQSKSLTNVLNTYLKLKDELVAGNSSTAAVAAAGFKSAVEAGTDSASSAEDVKALGPVKQKLLADAAAIAAAKDISKQRDLFSSLSNNMIGLAKATTGWDNEMYVVYCPMKKASWLSTEKEIKNPYFGSTMLTCGSVKETIKQ